MRDEWSEFDRDARRGGVRLGAIIVIAILFFALVGMGIWGFRVLTADVRGAGNQVIKTKGNADYRIAAYDRFYDSCAAIQSKEDQIKNLEIESMNRGISDSRKEQIRSSITALRNSRASLIRQYNADARKEDTRAAFRSSDLPYEIDPSQETTSCAA